MLNHYLLAIRGKITFPNERWGHHQPNPLMECGITICEATRLRESWCEATWSTDAPLYETLVPKFNFRYSHIEKQGTQRSNQINRECGTRCIKQVNDMYKNKQNKGMEGTVQKSETLRDTATKCNVWTVIWTNQL